ncbi:manganese catalase [Mycolicibacterium elephantis]|uniref:Manganese catalase n=1 Tax=Mycolicibacterium elephantis TaxID=81858 RepID=A0A0M2ZES6_9MYCO|nr:manganese catalase family protein [Mycolicibacterium elephantis]KKW62720.1 manganese catalase [Mycolicibacterium elephantis]OBA68341.1 manganese catalase [Mycolicibacterium elephantis]OBB24597.1 manganese catalase [Mycolicibacterium elephantis]OBE99847.1 manganese catalase [Mycolicibacterium elephantis]ORA59170.1 manganese catalase [Mycolicibacterium elephantis]
MFVHNKDLQFEVRVSEPDPRFATLLQEQFGGANGELKAAMQYFTQAFVLRQKNPKMYDLFMDIATEEFSHLEMVGSMITMLLDGLNDDLKMANERCDWMPAVASRDGRDDIIHSVAVNPLYFTLSGGGPDVKDSAGVPWQGTFVNANGDPTVDLRSNLAAESRAKIVYEYLKQFTDDPGVQDTLTFLMTREVAHFQQFTAALNELPVNFPPGQLPGDDRFQNVAFNMSNGAGSVRGPWNEGQGPWPEGMKWDYVEKPEQQWLGTKKRENKGDQRCPEGQPAVQGEKPFTHEQHTATS